jgi:hypothetical protein
MRRASSLSRSAAASDVLHDASVDGVTDTISPQFEHDPDRSRVSGVLTTKDAISIRSRQNMQATYCAATGDFRDLRGARVGWLSAGTLGLVVAGPPARMVMTSSP